MSDKSLVSSNEVWLAIQQRVRGIQTKSIEISETGLWHAEAKLSAEAKQLLNLYAPVVATSKKQSLVVAHLGQSLDGYISTVNGDSHYVNGTENIIHLHRMRALFDAVLVGANTVDIDNPTLTTRLVSGDNPVRVVIDPQCRLGPTHTVFTDDSVPTVLLCAKGSRNNRLSENNHVEIIGIPATNEGLPVRDCIRALRSRGLLRLFVEGGGDTVTRFFNEGTLDRLQISVAPTIFGSGRPGLCLPPTPTAQEAFRPKHCSHFQLGDDILFDFELTKNLVQQ